ncbi:MAG: TolC family protein [Bacteroidales bacterium]|nr:TolC family protein [Bacteroidales bacterium]
MNTYKYLILIPLFTVCFSASAEKPQDSLRTESYSAYIEKVKSANLGLMALRYNLDIAGAEVQASKILPDPELNITYFDNNEANMQLGYGAETELSYTLELGGKRKARIQLAQSALTSQELMFAYQFKQLLADATLSYLQTIRDKALLENAKDSYLRMLHIAKADSIRFSKGALSETDFRQSRLEANSLQNNVYQASADIEKSLSALLMFKGMSQQEERPLPAGDLSRFVREYHPDSLMATAKLYREDLRLAKQNIHFNEKNYRLVKANRRMDVNIAVGGNFNSEVTNPISPVQAFNGMSAGITVPLKFSNFNKGDLKAAQFSIDQSKVSLLEVERQIETEVKQNYAEYLSACRKVQQYTLNMLEEAETVLNGKIYAYERGETGLIEVLNAHRTYNKIQCVYIEELYHRAMSLVELERSCGIWDIAF